MANSKRQDATNHDITDSQQAAIASLLAGQTTEQAATAAGVSRQTVSAWRNHDVDFQLAYNVQRQELLQTGLDALRAAGLRAVVVLLADLERDDPVDRARAAGILLRTWAALRDTVGDTGPTSHNALVMAGAWT